jgi:hypothetical protein
VQAIGLAKTVRHKAQAERQARVEPIARGIHMI